MDVGDPRIARVDHASCQIVVAEMNALVDGIGDDPQGIYGDTDEAGVLTKDVLFACILGKLPDVSATKSTTSADTITDVGIRMMETV